MPELPNDQAYYYDYLQKRSRLGDFYRQYVLYPRLAKIVEGKVLDVGCGVGGFLKFHRSAIGVDINPALVEQCTRNGHRALLMEENRLPFDSGEFDGIVMDNVLEHIEFPSPILAEIRRVLRSGGIFLVGVPGVRGYAHDPDHKIFYDEDQLFKLLSTHNFIKLKHFYMPWKWQVLNGFMRQYCLYGIYQTTSAK